MLLKSITWIIVYICLSLVTPSIASEQIQVVALFKDKAMIEIDGRRKLMRVGDTTSSGIKLVSANPDEAILEIEGKQERFGLGSRVGGQFSKREAAEVKISRSPNGAYNTVGSINGRVTSMMVDTGATAIAMSEVEAKRLGIPYRLKGKKTGVGTASGFARAYMVTLDKVQVGAISLTQVEAYIVEGSSPTQVLLGMSFLKRVEIQNEGNLMILRKKF